VKKKALRTHDSRFRDLPGYPFRPHYLCVTHPDYKPLRLHFLDEKKLYEKNPATHESITEKYTLLLLHGCPTWSYLYRNVISTLLNANLEAGIRIIAPDFIGCGKSDKLLERSDYRYDFYVDTLKQFIEQLDLQRIVLIGQDWGGPIGLRVVREMPQRFSKILVTNTLLPNAEPPPHGVAPWPGDTILNWVRYTQHAQDMQIVQGSCVKKLPADVIAAYDAPFPDAAYKQGMLGWPALIPLTESSTGIEENRNTWKFLERSNIPLLTAFSDSDPSTAGWEIIFQQRAHGAKSQRHQKILHAGHMVQEDKGDELALIIQNLLQTGN